MCGGKFIPLVFFVGLLMAVLLNPLVGTLAFGSDQPSNAQPNTDQPSASQPSINQPTTASLLPCGEGSHGTVSCNPSKKDLKAAGEAFARGLKLQREKRQDQAF